MNNFEQVFSDGHKMSLAKWGPRGSMSDVQGNRGWGFGVLNSEIQSIVRLYA